jgi:hypothetical protein
MSGGNLLATHTSPPVRKYTSRLSKEVSSATAYTLSQTVPPMRNVALLPYYNKL